MRGSASLVLLVVPAALGAQPAPTATPVTATPVTATPVTNAFAVTGISPGEGGPGTVVTVRGSGFLQVTQVTFGPGPLPSFRVVDDHTLTFAVPAIPGSHDPRAVVVVSTPTGHRQAGTPFVRRPRVDALSPLSAPAGETVTITGEDLQLAGCCVYFRSAVAGQDASAPLRWEPSTTRRTLVVPSTAASGGLRLESMALPFAFQVVR